MILDPPLHRCEDGDTLEFFGAQLKKNNLSSDAPVVAAISHQWRTLRVVCGFILNGWFKVLFFLTSLHATVLVKVIQS